MTLLNSVPPTLHQAIANPHLQWSLLDTHRQVWVSLCGVTAPFSWVLVHTVFVCAFQGSVSPVLYKCRLYGGVYGDLLQEGLCHTQVCCTQGPCPCGSPLLTRTYRGDTQTQFCLSLCGVSGSWCTQGLFEPSECVWWRWGVIPKANSCSESNPIPTRDVQRAQTNLACTWTQGPHRD